MDQVLLAYIHAEDSEEASQALESLLVVHATPVIRKTVRQKLPEADWPDLTGEVQVHLIDRLRHLRAGTAPLIEDFAGYAAVTAYRVCSQWLRERRPNYARLRNRVRYILEHDPRFRGRTGEEAAPLPPVDQFSGEAGLPLAELIAAILKRVSGPVTVTGIATLAAHVLGISDLPDAELPADVASGSESGVVERLDRRAALLELWRQLGKLPTRQRQAVLLGLDEIEAFPLCGIASVVDLARTLELDTEELAALWNRLPLTDDGIAARLGATRQQVINLRKSARERLSRKLSPRWSDLVISVVFLLLPLLRASEAAATGTKGPGLS